MNADLANDPLRDRHHCGADLQSRRRRFEPALKVLPVASTDAGPYVPYTLETVHDRSYPLYDRIYAYADRVPGKRWIPRCWNSCASC